MEALTIFSRLSGKHGAKLATGINLVLVVLIMLSIAQTVAFFLDNMNPATVAPVTSSAPPTAQSPTIDIASLSLFGKVQQGQAVAVVDAPETRLNLELKGVFTSETPENSTAIIAERNKDGEIYRVGDRLPGNAVLTGIYDDHILLRRGGRTEKLMFADAKLRFQASPGNTGNGSQPVADRPNPASNQQSRLQRIAERLAERKSQSASSAQASPGRSIREFLTNNRDQITQNPGELLSQAGLTPVADGKLEGYKVSGTGQEAALIAAGLKAGDVVLSVNGKPVGDAVNDTALIDQALSAKRVRVEVQRDSRKFYLTVPIPD